LGWTDDASPETAGKVSRWFLRRDNSSQEPIHYGDVVAIGCGNDPSFLHFENRVAGINLGWSSAPVFEWKLLGGKHGEAVKASEFVAIFNMKSEGGECLIYFDREVGGDVGWPSTESWAVQLKKLAIDAAVDQAKKAATSALLGG
jgi:hypothetical protein